jgi:hypothetical protein
VGDRTVVDAIKARFAARGVRAFLSDLGALEGATGNGRGAFLARCFWHSERSASCSVEIRGGVLLARCHGSCQRGGDALDIIAERFGLDMPRDFPEVVKRAAQLAGVSLDPRAPLPPRPPAPPPEPPRSYPLDAEVKALWGACVAVTDDQEAAAWLRDERGLDPAAVEDRDLARALPHDAPLPRWATFQGSTWTSTGHRLLVPVYDGHGAMRSVRASRLRSGDSPKRLPPAGHRAAGLVLADPLARLVLSGEGREGWPSSLRMIVTEGEPDFLTWATHYSAADEGAPGVIGVVSGAWTAEIAARLPEDLELLVDTDHDQAGDTFAAGIVRTLRGRCRALRLEVAA